MIIASAIPLGEPRPGGCLEVSDYDDVVPVLDSLSGSAVLVYPARHEVRSARIAREVVAHPDLAKVVVSGTPTQQALAVRSLALLRAETHGMAQHVADVVSSVCRIRVALSSVAKLSQPRPTLMQHLRSLFPGASFEVDMNEGTVESRAPITWSTGEDADVCRVSSEGADRLQVSLTGAARPVDLPPPTVSPYGARRWSEVGSVSSLAAAVDMALRSARTTRCRGCGRVIPTTGCPFCGTALNPSRDQIAAPQL